MVWNCTSGGKDSQICCYEKCYSENLAKKRSIRGEVVLCIVERDKAFFFGEDNFNRFNGCMSVFRNRFDWQKIRHLKQTSFNKNRQHNQESINNFLLHLLQFFSLNVNQNCQSGNVQSQTDLESNTIGLC